MIMPHDDVILPTSHQRAHRSPNGQTSRDGAVYMR
jgi:hypothetical protein